MKTKRLLLRAAAALIRAQLNHPDYLTSGQVQELRDVAKDLDSVVFPEGRPEKYE